MPQPTHECDGFRCLVCHRQRALADLVETARDMKRHGRAPWEAERVLAHQAALWHQLLVDEFGIRPSPFPVLRIVQGVYRLPAYRGFNRRELMQETERYLRACVLANWLRTHAGSATAEAAVQAVERCFAVQAETKAG